MNTRTQKPTILSRSIAAALALPLIAAWVPQAQAELWVPTAAGTFDWGLAANWNPATVPDSATAIANIINDIVGAQTINLNANRTVNDLNLGDSNATHAFTIATGTAGSLLIFGGTNPTLDITGNSANTISASTQLAANATFRSNGTVETLISGVITNNGTIRNLTFNNDLNGTVTAAGTNQGQFSLTAANTFGGATGTVSISDVRVRGTVAGAFGANALNTVTMTGAGQMYVPSGTHVNNIVLNGTGWVEAAGNFGGLRVEGGGIVSGTVTMSQNSIIGSNSGTGTVSGIVSGAFSLSKAGAGILVLSGANTYTGTTFVNAGTLTVQNNAALGTTAGGTTIVSGGMLNLGGTLAANALNLGTEAISVAGTGVGGIGAIVATGTAGHQSAIGGAVTLTNATTFGGTQRWDIRNGTLNGGGNNLTKVGTNSIFLSGTTQIGSALNSLTIQSGEYVFETGAVATAANITNGITIAPSTAVTAAFRSFGNAVDHSANIAMNSSFAGSSTRLEVQNGTTTHSGTITATGGDNRLDVDGNQRMIISGVLAGAGNFSKEDAGLLLVNNAINTQSGLFTVNGGILGGVGTLASSTVAVNNGAMLSPGNALASSGTLSVTNILDLNGTNSAVFNLGTSSDLVNAGTLNQDGTTNIFVVPSAGFTPGTYVLFDYGTISGATGFGGFSLAASHVDGTLVHNLVGTSVDLTLNSLTPLAWTGESNGLWSSGSITNPCLPNFSWLPDPDDRVEYVNFDNVLFDDTNTGTTRIIVTSTITPASIEFNNSVLNYTVDSQAQSWIAGNIAGTTGIVKNGTATTTLLGANTFTGNIAVNAGTLQLGNDSRVATLTGGNSNNPSGSGPAIVIAAGATLGIAVGNDGQVTYSNNISGAGNIVLNASEQNPFFNYAADRGNVNFSGDNSLFSGTITINDGNRLGVTAANQLGGAAGVVIQNGGSLITGAAVTFATPFSIAGKGWAEVAGMLGALRVSSGATLSGPITMTGDSRITAFGGTGTISGAIGGAFNLELGFNHTGTGSGTLTLSNPASTYSGDTSITRMTINADTLAIAGANSSLGSGDDIVMNASTLNVTGAGPMTSNRTFTLGALGIGASTIGVTNAANTLTLTGAINNVPPVAASGQAFRQNLNFLQTTTAGTGGTVVINTATPIVTSGTTVHRQNLTLAGTTNFTVGASGFGTAGAFNVGNSTGTDVGNATVNIQDNAVLTVFGDFDIGNQGVAQTYVFNQSGTSIVNALRGGTAGTATASDPGNRALRIGHWGAENSTYNLTGGTLNAPNGDLWVGYDGGGTLNQSAGTTVNALGIRMVRSTPNTLSSIYNLNGGIVNVGSAGLAKGGAGTAVPQFNLNGGTYRATADHAISSNIAINVQAGGGTIDTNGFNVTSGSRLIGVGAGTVTKAGFGELVLPAGNNDYTGATNITGGTLTLNGATSLITASSLTTVGSGATLAGTGGVTAAFGVTVASGGTVSPGLTAGSGLGALTLSTLSTDAGSNLNLAPGATTDRIDVTNAYNPTAGSAINVLPVGNLIDGTYVLVDYGTIGGGGVAGLVQNIPHFTLPGTAIVDNIVGTSVDLVVPLGAVLDTMTWTGTGGAVWDHNVTANTFTSVANPNVAYLAGDRALFDDSSAIGAITVAATGVTPADVSFNNSSTAYTLTGGGITGGTALTKAGTATTILANNNSYAGTTTISAGILQIGNGGTTGTLGLGATINNGTLAFNRSNDSTYNGIISGTGSVRSDGSGTTALTATNTYSGGTTVSKGTLLGNSGAFGSGTITLNDAATGASDTALLITPFNNIVAVTVANNIVVANFGSGTATIGSSEDNLVNTGTAFTGTLQLDRPTRLLGEFDRTTFTNVISGNVGTLTIGRSTGLEDFEQGRVVLEKDNTFVGNVVVENYANLEIRDISNSPANTPKNQIPDTASVTLGDTSFLSLGVSGTPADPETIGDLISSFSTSRVRNISGAANALTYGTANDATFNGVVEGNNTFDLIKQGTGIQTFGGTLDNPSGRMIVNAGTVILAKDSSNVVHAIGGPLVINTSGTVQLGGTYTAFRDESSNRDNATQYQVNAPANFGDQIFNNVDVTVNAGGTLDLNGKSEVFDGLLGAGTVTNSSAVASTLYLGSANSADTFSGVIQDGAGTVNIAKGGTGTMVFGGTNTYTGTTSINTGALTITNVAALGSATGGTFINANRDGGAGVSSVLNISIPTLSDPSAPNIVAEPITLTSELSNDLRTNIGNTVESTRLTGLITIQGDGLNQINAGQAAGDQFQINGGISGTATGILFLRGNFEMALNSVINAPNVRLSKTDPGLLILNATGHDYFETNFVHGTVRADVVNALDTGAILRMGQAGNANTFDMNGNNQQIAGLLVNPNLAAAVRTITSVAPAILTINTPAIGNSYGYSGSISGAVTLNKTGPGSQSLLTPDAGNSLTYTGDTIVNQGVLKICGPNLIPDGVGFGNVIVGNGLNTAFLDLNGNAETINGLHGNSLGNVSSNGVGTPTLTVNGTATPATTATFAGVIKNNIDGGLGALALRKSSLGTQILSGINTYTGATTVTANGGTLEVAGTGALGGTSSLTINSGGTLLLSGTGGTDTKLNPAAPVLLAGVVGTPAVLSMGGMTTSLDQQLGALTLSGDSIIDFGTLAGGNIIRFDDSDLSAWTGTLSIYNWSGTPITGGGLDRIYFGDGTGVGLTASQLAQISFFTGPGTGQLSITGSFPGNAFAGSLGEVVPVPEPSSVALAMGLLGLIGWRERRKTRQTRTAERRTIG